MGKVRKNIYVKVYYKYVLHEQTIHALRMNEGDDIRSHMINFNGCIYELLSIDVKINVEDKVISIFDVLIAKIF